MAEKDIKDLYLMYLKWKARYTRSNITVYYYVPDYGRYNSSHADILPYVVEWE